MTYSDVTTTGYQYPRYNMEFYNPSTVDMETMMSTGYNPTSPLSANMDYGIFYPQGYASPYALTSDTFNYTGGLGYGGLGYGGLGYDMSGLGYGGMYGYSPMMMQAMVQSQISALDGQKVINGKKREMGYSGQVADMGYQTMLKDAKDTNHEDTVRRDTNFKHACDKLNERLEAKDTEAALEAYNYALSLMATVYDDVDEKRLSETPSARAAIKGAFERKYQEVYGMSFKDKIKNCLPSAFGSGYQSAIRMQDIMSQEEMLALVDDRNVAFRGEAEFYKGTGKICAYVAPAGVLGGIGALAGKVTKFGGWKGFVIGGIVGGIASVISYFAKK